MGNKNTLLNHHASNGVINLNQPMDAQIQLQGSQEHPILGQIQIWKLNANPHLKIFAKIRYGSDQEDRDTMTAIHDKRSSIHEDGLLKYYGCIFYNKFQLLTNHLECHYFFEFPERSLHQIIEFHKKNLSFIKEEKVLQLIQSLASTLHYLQQFNLHHGDLNPQSIFLDQNQHTKIVENGILPQVQNGYTQMLAYNRPSLLSPKLLDSLKQQKLKPYHNPYKSDIYSLGMSFLQAISQLDSLECYRASIYQVSQFEVDQRIEAARQNGYSDELIGLIQKMLDQDENTRIDYQGILRQTQTILDNFKRNSQERTAKPQSRVLYQYKQPQPQTISPVNQVMPANQANHGIHVIQANPVNQVKVNEFNQANIVNQFNQINPQQKQPYQRVLYLQAVHPEEIRKTFQTPDNRTPSRVQQHRSAQPFIGPSFTVSPQSQNISVERIPVPGHQPVFAGAPLHFAPQMRQVATQKVLVPPQNFAVNRSVQIDPQVPTGLIQYRQPSPSAIQRVTNLVPPTLNNNMIQQQPVTVAKSDFNQQAPSPYFHPNNVWDSPERNYNSYSYFHEVSTNNVTSVQSNPAQDRLQTISKLDALSLKAQVALQNSKKAIERYGVQ